MQKTSPSHLTNRIGIHGYGRLYLAPHKAIPHILILRNIELKRTNGKPLDNITLNRYFRNVTFITLFIIGVIGLLSLADVTAPQSSYYRFYWDEILLFASAGVGLAMLGFDIAYILTPINRFRHATEQGFWDTLILTSLTQDAIFNTMYVVEFIRTWRIQIVEMAIRAVWVSLFVFMYIIVIYRESQFDQIYAWIVLLFLLLLSAFLTLEPLWRNRAYTALGLYFSTIKTSLLFAVLMGVAASFGLRILMVMLVGFSQYCCMMSIVSSRFSLGSSQAGIIFTLSIIGTIIFSLFASVIYGFYYLVELNALQNAKRRAFRLE